MGLWPVNLLVAEQMVRCGNVVALSCWRNASTTGVTIPLKPGALTWA